MSGMRDSRKAGSLWGMMRGVGGVRKSIHHSWLAKGLGLGLLCWGFKEVQQEIPSEEASTLQIWSVAFPPGQYTSPQLHLCHRLFNRDGHQNISPPSIRTLYCWVLSKEVSSTIFKVFSMTRPGVPNHWRTLYPLDQWAGSVVITSKSKLKGRNNPILSPFKFILY